MLDNLQDKLSRGQKKSKAWETAQKHRVSESLPLTLPCKERQEQWLRYPKRVLIWLGQVTEPPQSSTEKHRVPLSRIPWLCSGLPRHNFIPVISRGDKVIFTNWPAIQGRYSCSCRTEGILSRLWTVEHHRWLSSVDQRKRAQRYDLWSPRARPLEWKRENLWRRSCAKKPAFVRTAAQLHQPWMVPWTGSCGPSWPENTLEVSI